MSVQQIEELIRIRISNVSAIKRRIKNVRGEHQREMAIKELASAEAEIESLKEQLEEAKAWPLLEPQDSKTHIPAAWHYGAR